MDVGRRSRDNGKSYPGLFPPTTNAPSLRSPSGRNHSVPMDTRHSDLPAMRTALSSQRRGSADSLVSSGAPGSSGSQPLIPLGNQPPSSSSRPHAQFEALQDSFVAQQQQRLAVSQSKGSRLPSPGSVGGPGGDSSAGEMRRRGGVRSAHCSSAGGGGGGGMGGELVARAGEPAAPADGIYFAQYRGQPDSPLVVYRSTAEVRPT